MTESEYVSRIEAMWPSDEDASVELLEFVEEAVAEWPESVRLWVDRGHLIFLSCEEAPYELEDCLRSYERAAVIAPDDPEPQAEIGAYHDTISDDIAAAETHYRRALELGAGPEIAGYLARAVAQQGRREEALAILRSVEQAAADDQDLSELADEVREGIWILIEPSVCSVGYRVFRPAAVVRGPCDT